MGRVAGAERLSFTASIGPSPGAPINVELLHDDMDVLERASADLAETLRDYAGVWDVDDGFAVGKPQLDLSMTPEATSLGLTAIDLARQVRSAFYGAEALRQQVGRNEVKVVVRLPADERRTIDDVESMLIRTPGGGEIPLSEAAEIRPGRAWPVIQRSDGRRLVEVTANVQQEVSSPGTVLAALQAGPLEALAAAYPGLDYAFGGSQREQDKAMGSLAGGAQMALVGIFALLAIPFRSYVQPLIVMTAIPFGAIGAIAGHVLLGFELSMISVMGLVALAGVVVNDSIVLIAAANDFRAEGMSFFEAIHAADLRRFRPILLTSLTTFFGLMPMILETSVQARFLIPMAVSLGFGVLFATFIVLLLVPSLYLVVEDARRRLGSATPSATLVRDDGGDDRPRA